LAGDEDTRGRPPPREFAVLLEQLDRDGEAIEIAERLCAGLEPPLLLAGRELRPSASVGIAWAGPGATAVELLRNADVAMYAANDPGKAQVAAFEDAMHEQVVERMELTVELAKAVESGELVLQYQPIIDLRTGEVADLEALVRWDHPARGRLSPDRFIPLAESSGAIVALGEWVLRTACAQLCAWRAALPGRTKLGVSVNVSTRQLARDDFPERVATILGETVRLGADDGVTLRQSGSFAGAPLGRGSLRMRTRVGQGRGAVVTFALANGRGSVRGRADVALTFRGANISYDGRATITAGTGAFRALRARGLRVTGRGELAGETFAVRLTGRVSG
jgi:EAL domain-containing protein/diguanylate cyclase with GGDEF domain